MMEDNLFDDYDDGENYNAGDSVSNSNRIDVAENKYENKVFQLQQMITHFEYRLKGYSLTANGDNYYYTGDALIGRKTIIDIMMLLHPFSREINMISNKQSFSWEMQKLRTRLSFIRLVTKSPEADMQKAEIIWRSFSNILTNIGDIIVGKNSQGMINNLFGMGDTSNNLFPSSNIGKKKEDDS